jgi:trehalose synthase
MMQRLLKDYIPIVGSAAIDQLRQLADDIVGLKIVHVNSTKAGGGVAEILSWMTPLMRELGLDATWETIDGNEEFFRVTKNIHNGLQGKHVNFTLKDQNIYESNNRENAERLQNTLENADAVFIHDPQPAYLIKELKNRKGKWIWRCHIDVSTPDRKTWKYLREIIDLFEASIFSMAQFAQPLIHPQFIIAPSIDPLSNKNCELPSPELGALYQQLAIDPARPVLAQISRFDRFKDPVGVIKAYKLLKKTMPIQLILAGGGATDDPEGNDVLQEVMDAADSDKDIRILMLPNDKDRLINGIQRIADIIIQKSTREGFGLTVTEGMWKGKPIIGGDTGGIRLQVSNYNTGFLVKSPEGAALRIRHILHNRDMAQKMGLRAKEFVRENFLLTRHLREYLTLLRWQKTINNERSVMA